MIRSTIRNHTLLVVLTLCTIPGIMRAAEEAPAQAPPEAPAEAPKEDPIPKLIQALQDPDAIVRMRAAKSLGEMGAEAQPAVEALRKALDDEDQDVRLVVKRALQRIEVGSNPELKQLIADLKNPDPLIRLRAAKKLGELGSQATVALPALRDALQDQDEDVRRIAQHAIEKIQSSGSPKVRKLIEQLRDEDAFVRLSAAKKLGDMGEEARPAMEALKATCQDPDEVVAMVAKNALEKLAKATNVEVDPGDKLTEAIEQVTVVKTERIFNPPETSAGGFMSRSGSMRFFVTLKNTGQHPIQVGTLRVRWLMGQEEIHNDDVTGPILPLLGGQTVTHTFALRWERDSRWDRRTKAVVEVALATPLELDKADRAKLDSIQKQLAKLKVINPKPIYQYGVLLGDQFTIHNANDQICKNMVVALKGYDSANDWICSVLYHIPIVPKGYTHITNNSSQITPGKRSMTKFIDYQYATPEPQIKRLTAVIVGMGIDEDEIQK